MFYFDMSFMAPLLLSEAKSTAVEEFITGLPAGQLAISHWTRVEFSSLLAREVRMGHLSARDAIDADSQFEMVVTESFLVLQPDIADFDLAKSYLQAYATGLRAGDALHLAIAWNSRVETVFSLDKAMLKAGGILGLSVSSGIEPD
ncbi:MAG: type II toxin-antitoxin system VapC family toxin [Beijerinckiaceae bacterium]